METKRSVKIDTLPYLSEDTCKDCYSSMNKKDVVRSLSGNNDKIVWTVYTKKGCPYCMNAKQLLIDNKQNIVIIEVNETNKDTIYEAIDDLTGKYRYFPVIFENSKFIGGFAELKKNIFLNKNDKPGKWK